MNHSLTIAAVMALALQAPAVNAQGETRAQVKAETAQAIKKGEVPLTTEVDPENQKAIDKSKTKPAAKSPRATKKAASAAN